MATKSLSESLHSLFKELGHEKKIKQMQIIDQWPDLVGDQISAVAAADKIRDEILYVRVSSMTWKTELTLRKDELLRKIEERLGADIIVDIRFTS